MIIDANISADPPDCRSKYFTILSIDDLFIINMGKKPNSESSNPIHMVNQLGLLIIIVRPVILVKENTNHAGYNFIINYFIVII